MKIRESKFRLPEDVKIVRQCTMKYRCFTPDEYAKTVIKYKSDMSITTIADEYGYDYTTNSRIFKANWYRNPVIRIIEI